LLPGAGSFRIDVRTISPRRRQGERHVPNWQGDLYMQTQIDQPGPYVTIRIIARRSRTARLSIASSAARSLACGRRFVIHPA